MDKPANVSSVTYEGMRVWDDDYGLPSGTFISAYCKEGMKTPSNKYMVTGRCTAALTYSTTFSECAGKFASYVTVFFLEHSNFSIRYSRSLLLYRLSQL